jgi:sulfur-oxidizing protein SoxY
MAGTVPGLLKPALAAEEKEDIKDVLKKFFGDRKIETGHVDLKVPIIAENGAVVPITVTSDLPMTPDNYVKKIYVFAEGNLRPFTASMELTPANGKAELALRIKMRQTSDVRAVVETNTGKLYQGSKPVKVTIGGCGG